MPSLDPLLWIGAIVVGFLVLNQGATFITDNAARVAGKIRRSRFVVGALLVSTISALPELLVSGIAVQEGSPDMALGNALASTVVTIAFVIGMSAIQRPIKASREIVLRDAVFLAIVSVVAAALLLDGGMTAFKGVALMALFVPYTLNLVISQRTSPAEEIEDRIRDMTIDSSSRGGSSAGGSRSARASAGSCSGSCGPSSARSSSSMAPSASPGRRG